MIKTVLLVDLVRYSAIAKILQENFDRPQLVTDLNNQTQSFIDEGLESVKASRQENVLKTMGDGALLLFDCPNVAFNCAEAIHRAAAKHNQDLTDPHTKRYFRIGEATGNVDLTSDSDSRRDIAGVAVNSVPRLESAAMPGEIVVADKSYPRLSGVNQKKCGEEELISGKPGEEYRVRRCRIVTDVDPWFLKKPPRDTPIDRTFRWIKAHPAWTVLLAIAVGALVWIAVVSVLDYVKRYSPGSTLPGDKYNGLDFLKPLPRTKTGRLPDEEKWFIKLIERMKEEASAAMDGNAQRPPEDQIHAHVAVFVSRPLLYQQSVLRLNLDAYRDINGQIEVTAFLFRTDGTKEWVRLLDYETEVVRADNNTTVRFTIRDVEEGDEFRVLILALSKGANSALPDPSGLEFIVPREN